LALMIAPSARMMSLALLCRRKTQKLRFLMTDNISWAVFGTARISRRTGRMERRGKGG
jgi:hypothetical protein